MIRVILLFFIALCLFGCEEKTQHTLSATKNVNSDVSVESIATTQHKPNIVIILTDDLGYGDLSIQGHPLIRTPNIDQLAREGQRWTSFYSSAPICNPSRVALMTGRMPIRINRKGKNLWEPMPDSEITLGEFLKTKGYATSYIGKWGIGSPKFNYKGSHPNDQGFDYFYGLENSNDGAALPNGLNRNYENIKNIGSSDFEIPLYRQRDVAEMPVEQSTLTKRYTEESVKWIEEHKDRPFFLYLAHSMPHVPLFTSRAFQDHSKAGLYGDVIEEIDWSVGQVMDALKKAGVADNTLVIFSSDNGPWRTYYDLAGSSGPWRGGKITGWDGGSRVPGIFWWPEKIKPAVVDGIGVNVDLMATIASLTHTPLPKDRVYDSIDLSQTLLQDKPSPRKEWFFYGVPGNLWAARVGDHKLVYESWEAVGKDNITSKTTEETMWTDRGYGNHKVHNPPLLFDLSTDMGERLNIADKNPEIVARIQEAVQRHEKSLAEDWQPND